MDRFATRIFTPVAERMAKNRILGKAAVEISYTAGLLALSLGYRSWDAGASLRAAAQKAGLDSYMELVRHYNNVSSSYLPGSLTPEPAGYLERGWVIANHKLVSFHAAFISSLLSLPDNVEGKLETLKFVFLSAETAISTAILYTSWHVGIAIHEMGHYLTAAKLTALNKASQAAADGMKEKGFLAKLGWYAKMFIQIPWGKFEGVKIEGGNYAPDAPYNLAVAASGPRWSGYLAAVTLPIATVAISLGLILGSEAAIYIGRFFLAPGLVGLLDRFLADRGKLKEYRMREQIAEEKASRAAQAAVGESWMNRVAALKERMINSRMHTIELSDGSKVSSPWQWRNCAMGGRHTEKEYPESNISMQESMFVPLSAKTYEEAQEMTVRLQYRLKEIIESAPGAKVMGIGLEGGLAPYVEKEEGDRVPEQRLWRMMKQAILDCGYVPGVDVAIALDPAASELENAYRKDNDRPDSVGMYRFWRDKSKVEMSREEILDLYKDAMEKDGIPIVSIEDGFGERDHVGWKLIMEKLGDKVFIIGDDLVTTKDSNIEACARNGEINAALIKANQIGTLSETVIAMLTALAYGAELVVSHRSKSPNDPFEADIATAMNAVGMKTGGGANTERLQKYGRVMEIMAIAGAKKRKITEEERKELERNLKELVFALTGKEVDLKPGATEVDLTNLFLRMLAIEAVIGTEEATNAGIPSAAATILLGKTGTVRFKGSTPLGTSAGEDEAIHYVDSMILPSKITEKYPDLFKKEEDGTLRFKKTVKYEDVEKDPELLELWRKANRYEGKGCLDAAEHIEKILASSFIGKTVSQLGSLVDIDRQLLKLELEQAKAAGRIAADAPTEEKIHVMQRKGVLGMNAILSMSLALGRAVAASQGKELWQLIREQALEAAAKVIAGYEGGSWQEIVKKKSMEEVMTRFKEVAKEAAQKEGKPVYELIRRALPVYPV